MKIFISYAHDDLPVVSQLAEYLRKGGHDVWYDQRLVGGKPWKDQLLAQIKDARCFLYALTPRSVASAWCQWEFAQAVHAGKTITTVLLEDTKLSGALNDHMYVDFRDRTLDAAIRLGTAVYEAVAIPPERVKLLPAPDSEPERPVAQTGAQRSFDDAYNAYKNKDYPGAYELVLYCLELEPEHREALALRRLIEKRLGAQQVVPVPPDDTQTDAPAFGGQVIVEGPPQPPQQSAPTRPRSSDLLPAPFDWIEIPGGRGTLRTDKFGVRLSIPTERYWIAKYPVTNAQFAKFIEAGGYRNDTWWTEAGWKERKKGSVWDSSKREHVATNTPWTEPRYWKESKWTGAEQPVVGVSWYEVVAFCRWLSETTGETIMLPNEAQWQYAAQGDDGRTYPWGNDWDCKRCNNSVKPCDSNVTTPVTQYEGKNKGNSFFGVVDMASNVWEWCLTDYTNGTNDVNSDAERRVLRGGSWGSSNSPDFRCDFRFRSAPLFRVDIWGFRPSRS